MTSLLPCLLVVLLALAVGYVVLNVIGWRRIPYREPLAFLLCIALALGLGCTSLLYAANELWLRLPTAIPLGFEAMLGACGVVMLAASLRRNAGPPVAVPAARPWLPMSLFLLVGAVQLGGFILGSVTAPHGYWDSWQLWNLKALLLYRHQASLIFAPQLTHSDYPLLLPAAVARIWSWCGSGSTAAPVAVAATFTAGTVLLLWQSLRALGKPRGGIWAGMALCAASFVFHGSTQYADIPLAFFILAALACQLMASRGAGGRWQVLAGLMAGFAAWTKNEGLIVCLALLASLCAAAMIRRRAAGLVHRCGLLLAGMALPLVLLLIIRWQHGTANDQAAALTVTGTLHDLVDWSRYARLAAALGREACCSPRWPTASKLPSLVFPLLAVLFPFLRKRAAPGLLEGGLALALVFCAYLGIYLVTASDLDWLLATSLPRLVQHLASGALLLYFYALDLDQRNDAAAPAAVV